METLHKSHFTLKIRGGKENCLHKHLWKKNNSRLRSDAFSYLIHYLDTSSATSINISDTPFIHFLLIIQSWETWLDDDYCYYNFYLLRLHVVKMLPWLACCHAGVVQNML